MDKCRLKSKYLKVNVWSGISDFKFIEQKKNKILIWSDDKKKSLDTLFRIIDSDKDGLISQSYLEKIMIATRNNGEGDNYGALNTFEKNGREDAETLWKKLDEKKTGKVGKEKFILTLSEMTSLPNGNKYVPGVGTTFKDFQNRFNTDKQLKFGTYYTEPGKKLISFGDLIKK